jgi:hypothetical protein
VRLLDSQRAGELDDPATAAGVKLEIPPYLPDLQAMGPYNAKVHQEHDLKRSYQKVVPKGFGNVEAWLEHVVDRVQEQVFR